MQQRGPHLLKQQQLEANTDAHNKGARWEGCVYLTWTYRQARKWDGGGQAHQKEKYAVLHSYIIIQGLACRATLTNHLELVITPLSPKCPAPGSC
jgi:hypothetical protein